MILQKLIEVFIRALDLLKAEGRAAREVLILVAMALVAVAAAGVIVIGGLVFLAFALYFALRPEFSAAGACLITGLTCLLITGVLLWLIHWRMSRRRRLVREDR